MGSSRDDEARQPGEAMDTNRGRKWYHAPVLYSVLFVFFLAKHTFYCLESYCHSFCVELVELVEQARRTIVYATLHLNGTR